MKFQGLVLTVLTTSEDDVHSARKTLNAPHLLLKHHDMMSKTSIAHLFHISKRDYITALQNFPFC